jgi:hypothetical protein
VSLNARKHRASQVFLALAATAAVVMWLGLPIPRQTSEESYAAHRLEIFFVVAVCAAIALSFRPRVGRWLTVFLGLASFVLAATILINRPGFTVITLALAVSPYVFGLVGSLALLERYRDTRITLHIVNTESAERTLMIEPWTTEYSLTPKDEYQLALKGENGRPIRIELTPDGLTVCAIDSKGATAEVTRGGEPVKPKFYEKPSRG